MGTSAPRQNGTTTSGVGPAHWHSGHWTIPIIRTTTKPCRRPPLTAAAGSTATAEYSDLSFYCSGPHMGRPPHDPMAHQLRPLIGKVGRPGRPTLRCRSRRWDRWSSSGAYAPGRLHTRISQLSGLATVGCSEESARAAPVVGAAEAAGGHPLDNCPAGGRRRPGLGYRLVSHNHDAHRTHR
jgi:hypothetical protein